MKKEGNFITRNWLKEKGLKEPLFWLSLPLFVMYINIVMFCITIVGICNIVMGALNWMTNIQLMHFEVKE